MKVQAKEQAAPESEEQKFKQKCKELKKRVIEIEESNEIATLALTRTTSSIRRMRLEYVILLERLEERAKQLPEGIIGFEEMACPPTPNVLDETLVKKNGGTTAKKQIKRKVNTTTSTPSEPKAKRDPDLPKRPTNAYLIFCEMEKDRIKQENEEKKPGVVNDLSKSMTEAWKVLNEEDRKPYYKLYEDDRERYQREMAVYNQKKQEEGEEGGDLKRQKLETETETPEVEEGVEVMSEPPSEPAEPVDEPETEPVSEVVEEVKQEVDEPIVEDKE
ncbi:Non-histone protein 10 [Spathaspora sp. JA1]|nr:Non-histone protein 10 [Spathaspora sp. JA1]